MKEKGDSITASLAGWCRGAKGGLLRPVPVTLTRRELSTEVECALYAPTGKCEAVQSKPECVFTKETVPSEKSYQTEYGTLLYDMDTRTIMNSPLLAPDHDPIQLPNIEGVILETLLRNQGRTLTREQLYDAANGGARLESRSIDVHIGRLREKLGTKKITASDYDGRQLIETVRQKGYVIPRIKPIRTKK